MTSFLPDQLARKRVSLTRSVSEAARNEYEALRDRSGLSQTEFADAHLRAGNATIEAELDKREAADTDPAAPEIRGDDGPAF